MVCSSGTSIFDRQKFLQRRVIMNQNLMVCSSGTSIFGRQEFCFQAEPCHEKLFLIQDHFLSPVLAVRGAGGQSGRYVHSAGSAAVLQMGGGPLTYVSCGRSSMVLCWSQQAGLHSQHSPATSTSTSCTT